MPPGYALARAVRGSPTYARLDDEALAECDALLSGAAVLSYWRPFTEKPPRADSYAVLRRGHNGSLKPGVARWWPHSQWDGRGSWGGKSGEQVLWWRPHDMPNGGQA